MEQYTIYCTEEQTKKALELGAPIKTSPNLCKQVFRVDGALVEEELIIYLPSAEQMLEWLRSKGFRFKIVEYANITYWQYHIKLSFKCGSEFKSGSELCYKDAVLSLIDAAIDYLVDNKLIK